MLLRKPISNKIDPGRCRFLNGYPGAAVMEVMFQPGRPTVLVATDFTQASRAAFDAAVTMAQADGAQVLLVHAVRPLGAPGLEQSRPDTTGAENETMEPVPDVSTTGAAWVAAAGARGVDAEVTVQPGLPAVVILAEAERVDARSIVLSKSVQGRLASAFLGSVSAEVRRGTSRSIVVVPNITRAPPRVG